MNTHEKVFKTGVREGGKKGPIEKRDEGIEIKEVEIKGVGGCLHEATLYFHLSRKAV